MITFLLLAAVFVGNDSCQPCHTAIVASYETTPMARSTGPVNGNVPPGRFRHAASGIEYTISNTGGVTMRRDGRKTQEQFDYTIGSGAAGFSYLIFRDRYLFQAPITWYSQKQRWDAAPGYQLDRVMAWDRPVDASCLLCHASQIAPIYGTFNRYAERPFAQPGVSCERCHGAGSEHVAGRAAMVAPSRLNAERRDDVCRQCHLMGDARIDREGRSFAQYRAGERLGDYVAYLVADGPRDEGLRTTSHVENLEISRCKQVSGDKMWCGTCHEIHTRPGDRVSWYREKCLGCHEPASTAACPRTPDCVSCHMPKSQAVDAGHGAFTDHSIARRPKARRMDAVKTWRLRPFSAADLGDRELALAYAQLYQKTKDERQKKEAVRIVNLPRPQ